MSFNNTVFSRFIKIPQVFKHFLSSCDKHHCDKYCFGLQNILFNIVDKRTLELNTYTQTCLSEGGGGFLVNIFIIIT